jgi:fermentation-respiration switch protein FrsA (DUF1100 family)/ketosteroid isomerase-like protein
MTTTQRNLLSSTVSRRAFLGRSAAGATISFTAILAPTATRAAGPSPATGSAPQRVRFNGGDTFIVGNLYLPAGYRGDSVYPAVVVGGSLTSVKEQMGGAYAAEMASRGFLALAIDYRRYGESGGEPRQYEDPATKAEDLSAAAAYLASRADVRPGGVGLIGICTSGGNVLYAAARDPGISAVATVAGHFIEPSITPSVPVYGGAEAVSRHRADGRAARAKYERTGENTLILAYHDRDLSASHVGPMEYYMDKRRGGGVPQWKNAFSAMSWEAWLDFDPVGEAAKVTTPTLIVHSDGCGLPAQARKVYRLLKGPKELHWAAGNHFDFYDRIGNIRDAADAIARFFRPYLTSGETRRDGRVQVARRFFELLHTKDIEAWGELWHERGRIIVYYPADGFPTSIDGKPNIVAGFRTLLQNFTSFSSELTGIYPAADSDAVVMQYRNRATLVGGALYTNDNIAVFRFEDGLIREYHDYFDPRRFQVVVDALRRPKKP